MLGGNIESLLSRHQAGTHVLADEIGCASIASLDEFRVIVNPGHPALDTLITFVVSFDDIFLPAVFVDEKFGLPLMVPEDVIAEIDRLDIAFDQLFARRRIEHTQFRLL